MKSKTSFINKGILLNDFKLFGWISVAYLLGLLLTVPTKILMIFSQQKSNYPSYYTPIDNAYLQIFHFDSPWQIILFMIVPVLTGLLLFRYLQSSHSADMNHALPIKRQTLYNTHLASGIILLFVPILITGLSSLAILGGLGIKGVGAKDVFLWIGISLLISLLFFVTSVATGMFTGMSSVQGALTYILLLLPSGLSMLVLDNLRQYLFGFAFDYHMQGVSDLSPLIRFTEYPHKLITGTELGIYLLVIVLLYLAGRALYQRRKLEMAGNAITFNVIRPIFKYGVTFSAMLLLGSYFKGVQNSMGWILFGYILGSFLGYFLSEILINKSLAVFKLRKIKGYVVFGLAMILLISVINYDLTGYEKRMPALGEIESVYLDNSFYTLTNSSNRQLNPEEIEYLANKFYQAKKIYYNEESIAAISALQQKIIANRASEKKLTYVNTSDSPRQNYCFAYQLKNGKTVYRQYSLTTGLYEAQLKPISESKEYRQLHYFILNTNATNIDMLEINVNEINKSIKIIDPVLINQAINALKEDALEQSYEEMTSNKPAWARINLLFTNKQSMNIDWDKSDTHFANWLKSIGKYENARLMPDDIEYAVVEKIVKNEQMPPDKYRATQSKEDFEILMKTKDVLKITDPAQLENCLQTYTYNDRDNYCIFFILKNGNTVSGGFSEQGIPDFVKSHFISE